MQRLARCARAIGHVTAPDHLRPPPSALQPLVGRSCTLNSTDASWCCYTMAAAARWPAAPTSWLRGSSGATTVRRREYAAAALPAEGTLSEREILTAQRSPDDYSSVRR